MNTYSDFSFSIYIGLFLTSKYVLDRYCPRIPIVSNWIPPSKNIEHIIVGNPSTTSPNNKVFTTNTIIIKNAPKKDSIPRKLEIIRGVVEKATIPSIEYFTKLLNPHLLSPNVLSILSYSI